MALFYFGGSMGPGSIIEVGFNDVENCDLPLVEIAGSTNSGLRVQGNVVRNRGKLMGSTIIKSRGPVVGSDVSYNKQFGPGDHAVIDTDEGVYNSRVVGNEQNILTPEMQELVQKLKAEGHPPASAWERFRSAFGLSADAAQNTGALYTAFMYAFGG